ncbi:MAG TPA: ABC transporter ATP-binding protein [Actinomycetota bacterium]|nr:ABC transporter ATP-binding protein [Actinomycetota bacterium]
MSAVAVEHLSRRYGGLAALEDVSFEVAAGQVVALLGPNGAGKTTTMEILEGYQAPSGGTARVLGEDPACAGRAWRARVGLVLQSTCLDPQLTVVEALGIFAGLFPRPRPVAEVLELIDLTDEAGTRVGRLSGGQQRRVDVGLGIVGQPELLFLDEPTTGLDPAARRQAWTTIEGLTAAGTTVLLTTHYLEEAQRLADRVLVLAHGRLVADARPEQLRRRGAPTVIRVPLPPGAPIADLPPTLAAAAGPDGGRLVVRTAEVTATLDALVGWARRHQVELAGLEVGPPSLEDAYLALLEEEVPSHA